MEKKLPLIVVTLVILLTGYIYLINQNRRMISEMPTETSKTLAIVEYFGGLCAYGACNTSVEILDNGNIYVTQGNKNIVGVVSETKKIDILRKELLDTNYPLLKAKKFTGTCPIAYDGQKVVYTFYRDDVPFVIDNCEYDVNLNIPLYKAIWNIMDEDVDPLFIKLN